MYLFYLAFASFFSFNIGAPQQPEINDQYENTTKIDSIMENITSYNITEINKTENNEDDKIKLTIKSTTEVDKSHTFARRLYTIITVPMKKFVSTPKVNSVLKNIGTCIVNGAMEIISYYFPTPLMPLIATAAGMVIPFEPVVMLREKMPVTSYRRAFKTAVDGFLNTFNEYKVNEEDNDPYMTRRFNRRFMNEDKAKEKLVID